MKNIRIALTNLGKYNEGELTYIWLELPASDEAIQAALNEIGIDGVEYEEYFISDYEAPFNISEYVNLQHLNEISEAFDALDDCETLGFEAYIDQYGAQYLDDVEEAIGFATSGDYTIWNDVNDMSDVAAEMVEQGYFEINENNPLSRYIDYDALGRDLDIEGTFVFLDGSTCVEMHV